MSFLAQCPHCTWYRTSTKSKKSVDANLARHVREDHGPDGESQKRKRKLADAASKTPWLHTSPQLENAQSEKNAKRKRPQSENAQKQPTSANKKGHDQKRPASANQKGQDLSESEEESADSSSSDSSSSDSTPANVEEKAEKNSGVEKVYKWACAKIDSAIDPLMKSTALGNICRKLLDPSTPVFRLSIQDRALVAERLTNQCGSVERSAGAGTASSSSPPHAATVTPPAISSSSQQLHEPRHRQGMETKSALRSKARAGRICWKIGASGAL